MNTVKDTIPGKIEFFKCKNTHEWQKQIFFGLKDTKYLRQDNTVKTMTTDEE